MRIEIHKNPLPAGGFEFQTIVKFEQDDSATETGMQLAAATRSIAIALADILRLPRAEAEQIEAEIAMAYNREMQMGAMKKSETQTSQPDAGNPE